MCLGLGILVALLVAGCSVSKSASAPTIPPNLLPPQIRSCSAQSPSELPDVIATAPAVKSISEGEEFYTLERAGAVEVSVAFSQAVFTECSENVVVVESTESNTLAVAARLAIHENASLLVNVKTTSTTQQPAPSLHPSVRAEINRLEPLAVTVIGSFETAQEILLISQGGGAELEGDAEGDSSEATDGDASGDTDSDSNSGSNSDSNRNNNRDTNQDAAQPPSVMLIPLSDTTLFADVFQTTVATTVAELMEVSSELPLPRSAGAATAAHVVKAVSTGAALAPPSAITISSVTPDTLGDPASDPAEILADVANGDQNSNNTIWLVPSDQVTVSLLALPAATAAGADLLYVHPDDIRLSHPATATTLRNTNRTHLQVGKMPSDSEWQLETVINAQQLPNGGFVLFPHRRIVAMYGHTNTRALGVLGEQGHEEGVERARSIAEGYDADGVPVVTAFEIITTIASSEPQPDGSYSAKTPIAELRPWIEQAEAAGMYVILDLQPGRTDFLTQAKEYEELLKLPHVGLALDPEWRLEPNQVHLRQVGSVDAAEVNQVVEWLANLVRENLLPQKLLVVHQFSLHMITNRSEIQTPPELAVMIHMDGQGEKNLKYGTYGHITAGALENGWWWGWKNFYDEDFPTLTAEETLSVSPVPYLVSYQ